MHNKAHITLVNAHTECGRGDHYLYLVADEFLLVLNLDDFLHLAMECLCLEAVIAQLLREFLGELCAGYIYDGRAFFCIKQSPQGNIFLLF